MDEMQPANPRKRRRDARRSQGVSDRAIDHHPPLNAPAIGLSRFSCRLCHGHAPTCDLGAESRLQQPWAEVAVRQLGFNLDQPTTDLDLLVGAMSAAPEDVTIACLPADLFISWPTFIGSYLTSRRNWPNPNFRFGGLQEVVDRSKNMVMQLPEAFSHVATIRESISAARASSAHRAACVVGLAILRAFGEARPTARA